MQAAQPRYHAIDHLRATMISIVMFGHAILPYVTIPRRFKDPQTHLGFDVVAVFLYSFAMPAFFVTAGFSTALILHRKGMRGLIKNRVQLIFLPLLAAYLVLSPVTRGAYKFATHVTHTGSIQGGIDAVLVLDWIRLSKPYHLWFLLSLLIFTVLAIGLRWAVLNGAGGKKENLRSLSRSLLTSRWNTTFGIFIVALTMVPAYVMYGSDATTWAMQLTLFVFFLGGWLLYLHRDVLPDLQHHPWRPITIAVVTLALAVWSVRARLQTPDDPQLILGLIAGVSQSILAVCMTSGLVGLYYARFNQPSALGSYVSDASYWIYLIHYPLLIAVAGALTVTPFPAVVKYLLTVSVVVPIVLLSYQFGVRNTPVGRLLKSRRNKRNDA
ncbi:MAG: acyltransferase family protein [Pseudomonadota bacterium]